MTGEIDLGWLSPLEEGPRPIYLKIADALAAARSSGRLQPGDRLPPQRELARFLGVDLTTVTRAFTEARRRNLIDATAGRGTFVTPGEPEEPILDLGMNASRKSRSSIWASMRRQVAARSSRPASRKSRSSIWA